MRLEVGLNLRLSQQLRLAPQIIQSIEILQLQAMDLKELIENELQENEALEIVEPARDDLPAVARERQGGRRLVRGRRRARPRSSRRAGRSGARPRPATARRASAEEASDRKLEAMQNTPAAGAGSRRASGASAGGAGLPADVRRAAEAIVYNLDDVGLPALPAAGRPRRDGRSRRSGQSPKQRWRWCSLSTRAASARATCASACSCR